MLGRTRRIHFVGIGGSGMSGIAELLANLGYEVSGSDAKRIRCHVPARTARCACCGRSRRPPCWVGGRGGDVIGDSAGQHRGPRGEIAGHSDHPARRDAGGIDASSLRDRDRRHAREDDDHVDDRADPRPGWPGPDRGDRRTAERLWQQCAARPRGLHGGGGGRERPVVLEAVSLDRSHHEYRPRAHGKLRHLGQPAAGVRGVREQSALLWCRRRVRG